MRILITSPVFPPDLGGPAVLVPGIGRFLVERGHEVHVVAFCSDPEPRGHPFEVTAVTPASLPVRYLKAAWQTFKRARRADVVFINEHLALLHVLAARLAGTPAVIRIMVDGAWEVSHRYGWIDGDDIDTFQGKAYGWKVDLTRRLQRLWWGWCRRIICCSDYLKGILAESYDVPAEKLIRIHNAYQGPTAGEVGESRAEARARLGLDPEGTYALTVCRLMVWKGVDGILRALEQLPEAVELLIAGDGDMRDEWEGLSRELGLEGRARFLGNVPHAEIPLYIRAADLFVLNSRYEGLSHTLLEVLTLGTAIVCTEVCGNPELVQDGKTGLLVPFGAPKALAGAMRKLIDDKALRDKFAAEGQAFAERFARARIFPQVEAVLVEAAAD